MTKNELVFEIKEILQRDEELEFSYKLEDVQEWDSLAIISIIALYDELFGTKVTNKDLKNCEIVQDLVNLVKDKLDD